MSLGFDEAIQALHEKLPEYLESHNINTSKHFSCIDPSHEDSSPSMSIFGDSKLFKCQGCGATGNIFEAAHLLEGMAIDGPEFILTLQTLAQRFEVEYEGKELSEKQKHALKMYQAYQLATEWLASNRPNYVLEYQDSKSWSIDAIAKHKITGLESRQGYIDAMVAGGFTYEFLIQTDLIRKNRPLFTEGHVIVPLFDHRGRPVGFQTRNLRYNPQDETTGMKFNSTRTVEDGIYKKENLLFNLNNARKFMSAYIVEGWGDCITLDDNGVNNVVASNGVALTENHAALLKECGVKEGILCLDGDPAGKAAIKRTIMALSTIVGIGWKVKEMPSGSDPDDLVREKGIDAFKSIPERDAFTWLLDTYDTLIDPDIVCEEVLPLIMGQRNKIKRDFMVRTLSEYFNISPQSVREEIDRREDADKADYCDKRDDILERMCVEVKTSPANHSLIIGKYEQQLDRLDDAKTVSVFEPKAYVDGLDTMKSAEESSISLVPWQIRELENFSKVIGEGELCETVNFFGGVPNVGKTALMATMGLSIARHNTGKNGSRNAIVIMHTIDDSFRQFNSRYVTQLALQRFGGMTLNLVRRPFCKDEKLYRQILRARDYGYQQLRHICNPDDPHLIVLDGSNGQSNLAFASRGVKYIRKRYPDKDLIYICDNLHKLQDYPGKEERIRFKLISSDLKQITQDYQCSAFATVEYTKAAEYGDGRPGNRDIAETNKIQYDANLICHIFNDLHTHREEATMFFEEPDLITGEMLKKPVVEMIFGKNKITGFKGSLYFKFHPERSLYEPISFKQVNEIQMRNQALQG